LDGDDLMPTAEQTQQAINNVTDQQSFINGLLRDTLDWPIELDFENIGDISYEWTDDELNTTGLSKNILSGPVLQMQSLIQDQPWGIFILEFTSPDVLTTGRGLTGPLRKVLRGLVPKRRRQANLPAWDRDNLLFICTHNYQHFRFAYFKTAKQKGHTEPLAIFGWDHGDNALRTLCEYNLPSLVWSDDPQQCQWREAFNVEKVTKGFYSQVATLFTDLVGGSRKQGNKTYQGKNLLKLPGSQDDTIRKEFAVRLIGRLVFCWFLKKKKSKDELPLLPQELLSTESINKKGIGGYYHSILEPLFFEVLNTPQDERKAQFKKIPWSIIPFLNGGLFTPHDDDFYKLTFNEISEHLNDLIIPDDWIRELYEVFDTYNFTIEESTPLNIEVAVDPEILGRIFENLLAEINPETGETARKATGSYYTPRPIVEYMVDESLKQYLITKTELSEEEISPLLSYGEDKTDLTEKQKDSVLDALDTIKIIDPACGSGAFPMGILQKILLVLQKIDPDSQKWLGKKTIGIPDTLEGKGFKRKLATENWDYVHKLGIIRDAIYGVDIQPIAVEIAKLRCFLSLIVDETVNDNQPNRGVEHLPNLEFKFVCANTLIGLPEAEVDKAKSSGRKIVEFKGQNVMFEATDEISELKKIRDEYLNSYGDEKKNLEKRFNNIQSKLRRHMIQWGKADTQTAKLSDWQPFEHKSCSWFDPAWMFGVNSGFDVAIGNPPYIDSETMVNLGLEDLRKYLVVNLEFTKGNWDIYIAFFEVAFNLLSKSGIMTYITPDKWISKPFGKELRKKLLHNYIIITESGRDVFESSNVDSIITFIGKGKSPTLNINKFKKENIIHLTNIPKKSIIEPFTFDWLFSHHIDLLNSIEKFNSKVSDIGLCDSACATSDAYKLKQFIINISEKAFSPEKHLKIINTGTIDKYVSKWGKSEMTYLGDKYLFPAVKKAEFLNEFSNTYGTKSVKSKLIIKGLTLLDVCYDSNGEIIPGKSTLIVTDSNEQNLKFLLGLLNCKLPIFYIKEKYRGSSYNQGINFNKGMINNFPIPNIDNKEKHMLVKIVEKILAIKEQNYTVDTTALQCQIDQMVYDIYNLTEEEIAIIEGRNKSD
jgi:hypothetical protein